MVASCDFHAPHPTALSENTHRASNFRIFHKFDIFDMPPAIAFPLPCLIQASASVGFARFKMQSPVETGSKP